MSTTVENIDEARLNEFLGRFVGDLGAALSAALVVIGDRLGLYRAMTDGESVSAAELAGRTGTDPRYVQEWLSNQAAGGYGSYHPDGEEFFLRPSSRWRSPRKAARRSSPAPSSSRPHSSRTRRRSSTLSAPVAGSDGISTITTCIRAPSVRLRGARCLPVA